MNKYTAEQVAREADLQEDHVADMLRDYAALLRERESAKTKSDPVAWRYRLDGDMQWQHTSDKRICMGEIEPLYAVAPMLASTRVPDARKLRLNGNVRQQSYDQGWNACRTAMLAAAPKTVLTESMDAQRYRLIRSGKSGIPLPLGSEALDVYLDLRLKVAPKPKMEE